MKSILAGILCVLSTWCYADITVISPYDNRTELVLSSQKCPVKSLGNSGYMAYASNNTYVGCWLDNPKNKFITLYNWSTDQIYNYTYNQLQTAATAKAKQDAQFEANFQYKFFKDNPNWGMPKTQPYIPPTAPPVQVQCWNNGFGTVQCGSL